MPDVFSKTKRSEVMSRIRGAGNRDTELRLIAIFRAHGITGWRRRAKLRFQVPGARFQQGQPKFQVKPDFVFRKLNLAVFVDGCFWHGCPKHGTKPRNNAAFWRKKIAGNQARDRLVTRTLRAKGWRVLRIWEHELARKNEVRLLSRLSANLGRSAAARRWSRRRRGPAAPAKG